MDSFVKLGEISNPSTQIILRSSAPSTGIEELGFSRETSFENSPISLSSPHSEHHVSSKSISGSQSPSFITKKDPQKSRIKTIGKNMIQLKKTFSSMNERKPIQDDPALEDIDTWSRHCSMTKVTEKYQFLEVLGKGAQGIVYKVEEKSTGKCFAAKKIVVHDAETFQNVQNEITLIKSLEHENIIKVNEIFNDEASHCIFSIYEYFPGKSLQEIVKNKQDLTQDQVKQILEKVMVALSYLHERNICHRDLTLENVLVCQEFKNVKLIDFGVAKKVVHASLLMLSPVGRGNNLPPEFESEGCYSTKFDIWLAGLLLLQILCKTHLSSKTALGVLKGLKEKNPKYTNSLRISAECEDLIGRLLEKDPEQRVSASESLKHRWLMN